MNRETAFWWALRLSWPALGGAWGAWVWLQGYFQLPHNADSFGSFFASAFIIAFACVGFLAGAAAGAIIGWLTEKMLRSMGLPVAAAVCTATLINALALWQIIGFVHTAYPGLTYGAATPLRSEHPERRHEPAQTSKQPTAKTTSNPCAGPPPTQPKELASWNLECR